MSNRWYDERMTHTTTVPLASVEVTRDEMEAMEEGTFCSSGLSCLGLTDLNYPAHVGPFLAYDADTGIESFREGCGWRFDGDPLGGVYCEDCTIEIEQAAGPRRNKVQR